MLNFVSFQSQFIRHDTPHPRDLKARHPKITMHKIKDAGHLDGIVIKSRKSFTVCLLVILKTIIIILHLKKLLYSGGLREMWFSGNARQKRGTYCNYKTCIKPNLLIGQ